MTSPRPSARPWTPGWERPGTESQALLEQIHNLFHRLWITLDVSYRISLKG
jgi:hypothetical protein